MEVHGPASLDGVAISEVAPPFGCDSEPTALPLRLRGDARPRAGRKPRAPGTIVIPDNGRFDEQLVSTRETVWP